MAELRWNPLLGTYTMVASNRQHRPNMPDDGCPFCPGEGKKVPPDFEVWAYPNDYPALSSDPPATTVDSDDLYEVQPAYGHCEVILYSPQHDVKIWQLGDDHVRKLVDLWADRFEALRHDKRIRYIFEFENRGREVGVTMPHPHGQLYAYPFVPQKLQVELDNAKWHFDIYESNLFDAIVEKEKAFGQRVLWETESFLVFLPFFTDYPYGIFVVSQKEHLYISDLNETERLELAVLLKEVAGMFDHLFGTPFPYMMCLHPGAVNCEEYPEKEQRHYFRFHIEFYPPLRAEGVVKYYASSEMGAWAAANTRSVEDTAEELRTARQRFLTNLPHA